MEWTREGFEAAGFDGFVRFAELPERDVPQVPGVYVVLRDTDAPPEFLQASPGGRFESKDPTVSLDQLQKKWNDEVRLLYVGQASGRGASGGLARRLDQYRKFGDGKPVAHWEGRYVWQLADAADLLVAWRTSPRRVEPRVEAARLLAEFRWEHRRLPFANLRW